MTPGTERPEGLDARNGLRVLIVEDHPDCAESTALMLRQCGHQVEVARDGVAALQMVAEERYPDVILLDIGLPGINGWEVAKQLKARKSPKPPLIIAVTGFGQDSDRASSEAAGIDLHLVKPANPQQLEWMLRRFHRVVGD